VGLDYSDAHYFVLINFVTKCLFARTLADKYVGVSEKGIMWDAHRCSEGS